MSRWLQCCRALRRVADRTCACRGPAHDLLPLFARHPGAARAGFAYYVRFSTMRDLAAARAASARRLPIALGAESGVGGALLKTLQPLGDNVRGGVLPDSGHFLPGEFMRAILDFLAIDRRGPGCGEALNCRPITGKSKHNRACTYRQTLSLAEANSTVAAAARQLNVMIDVAAATSWAM